MGIKDTKPAKGMSGEKLPKGAMGKADSMGLRPMSHAGKFDGQLGELKGGSKEHVAYEHKRVEHEQNDCK